VRPPTYHIVAKYRPKVDHVLFGRFLNLDTSSRLKWTHDCNPDGTGHIYKITIHGRSRTVLIKDELIKLGMVVELAESYDAPLILRLSQQLRQLGDIDGDPPRFIASN
jgi:hypothetical protein